VGPVAADYMKSMVGYLEIELGKKVTLTKVQNIMVTKRPQGTFLWITLAPDATELNSFLMMGIS